MRPIQDFMRIEAAAGLIMLIAAVVAIVWANATFGESYFRFLETEVAFELGSFHLELHFGHLINDGFMAIFFFVVGLEIKREMVLGELRDRKAAMLPLMAALGGMVFPALIYLAFNLGDPAALRGWGVPMATDIAFSVGVLSLMGKRVPSAAKLFLLALAIVDDLGGILVIAVFYTEELNLLYLGGGLALLVLVWLASRAGIRSYVFYVPVAVAIWYLFLQSGVHATLAGVALGFLTPARPMYSVGEFDRKARLILDTYPAVAETPEDREHADHEALLLAEITREAVAPLARNEHRLAWWSSFAVIPVFALANAGVRFEGSIIDALLSPVALGVGLGLVVGKTVGISLFSWLAVRLGLARLPKDTTWRQVVGVAATAGIGFTVALFITALAYTDLVLADDAKVGIFAGSITAGLIGAAILLTGKSKHQGVDTAIETVEVTA
jgi:NhaA family Na+:H+ antiporter